MKILVKFPTRSRPDKFFQVLDMYYSYANNPDNIRFVITCDADDHSMNNSKVIERLNTYKNLEYHFGNSRTKIEAVNADVPADGWDILLLASDDMIPREKGYDDIVRQAMQDYYPDTDGVLWYFDGHRQDLNTLCILGFKYYQRFKYIYHPDYITWWADVEFMEVAKALGKQTYFHHCIIEHQHYVWMHKRPDMLANKENESRFTKADERTYNLRHKNNFYMNIKLSILIPTLKTRTNLLNRLLVILKNQDLEGVEILTCEDEGQAFVGEKRNVLLEQANGKYIAYIDDDDTVSSDYIALVMEGIAKDVDCCSLTGIMTTSGMNPRTFIHSLEYTSWYEGKDKIYYRPPNHLNCIRASIAKQFKFPPDKDFAEDQNWSMQIADSGLLKTEHKINKPIYFYQYRRRK